METLWAVLQADLPTVLPALVVAVVLGYLGSKAVPMVQQRPASACRSRFLESAWAHPVLLGAMIGLSPHLPVPEWLGDSWEASVLWYALAGVVSLPVYRKLMRRIEVQE